jgi:formiminotetrahydrofolate cyclodeaminase
LTDAAIWYTQMDGFNPEQILEQRLYQDMSSSSGENHNEDDTFLDQLASATPTPGGGSAAAHTAAAGAALVAMVARLTVDKKKYADVQTQMSELIDRAEKLRSDLSAAVIEDSKAFDQVMAAFKLPKISEDEQQIRVQAIQDATINAARLPLSAAKLALEVMKCALEAASLGNTNAISDAASGFFLAKAGLQGSSLNVRINTISIHDQTIVKSLLNEVKEISKQADELEIQINIELVERGGLPQE